MFTDFGATSVGMGFSLPVWAWGGTFFGTQTNEGLTVDLIGDPMGPILGSFSPLNSGFYGFTTVPQQPVTMLIFRSTTNQPGTAGEGFGLDNVRGVTAPEPGLLALFALAGVAARRRLRRS
jgi:hypothetical protein